MTAIKNSTAALAILCATVFAVPAQSADANTLELTKPMAGSTMFFADRYATAYYMIDKANFKTVVTVAPGPDGKGNPMQFVNALSDGETAEYSVGGYSDNAILVKLRLQRTGDTVKAVAITETPEDRS